jgi:hypothetical protein
VVSSFKHKKHAHSTQMQKNDIEEIFASKRQEIKSQPHKAKSAIAHIAFLPTLTKLKMEF